MSLGKSVRMKRLFSHPSGRLCSVAVDHFIGYGEGLPPGLRHIRPTLAAIAEARPDAITMHKGVAAAMWAPYAGQIPLIIQSMVARADDTANEQFATPEEAIRLGADAIAVAIFVRGPTEALHLRMVADLVREAAHFGLPVICHIYPRDIASGQVLYHPDDIAWAVRCAVEAGADVVKAPYCGDVGAYAEIVADSPVPVVAAGGPKTKTLEAALAMVADVVTSGARGATIGRNVWGFEHISAAIHAFKAVLHDGASPSEAMRVSGL